MSTSTKYLAWLPVATLAVGLVGSYFVNNERMLAHADEILDLNESVDENEDDIEAIQRLLIQQQGTVALDIQRIETEQKAQGDDISEILMLLKQLNTETR